MAMRWKFEVVSVNDLRRRPKTDQDGARLYYAAESTCGNVDMSTFTQGRSDPPVKPTSEVAHQPGQQPALRWSAAQRDQERRTDNRWRLWRDAPGKPLRRGRFDQVTKPGWPLPVVAHTLDRMGHPATRTDRNYQLRASI